MLKETSLNLLCYKMKKVINKIYNTLYKVRYLKVNMHVAKLFLFKIKTYFLNTISFKYYCQIK